jgi:hypothetical protein
MAIEAMCVVGFCIFHMGHKFSWTMKVHDEELSICKARSAASASL